MDPEQFGPICENNQKNPTKEPEKSHKRTRKIPRTRSRSTGLTRKIPRESHRQFENLAVLVKSKILLSSAKCEKLKTANTKNAAAPSPQQKSAIMATVVDSTCGVCLETFSDKSTINGCTHNFCFVCIEIWSRTANSCPLCKAAFTEIRCLEQTLTGKENEQKRKAQLVKKVKPKRQRAEFDDDELRRLGVYDDDDDWSGNSMNNFIVNDMPSNEPDAEFTDSEEDDVVAAYRERRRARQQNAPPSSPRITRTMTRRTRTTTTTTTRRIIVLDADDDNDDDIQILSVTHQTRSTVSRN